MYIYIFFSAVLNRHNQGTLSFPFVTGIVFGLAMCLELSRLITLYTRSLTSSRAWKRIDRVSLYFVTFSFRLSFILNYNFADQETAQSRNLSQSPNPDLVLGPRLRGQSPGRSPNPKPSLPQSESSSRSDLSLIEIIGAKKHKFF